MLPYLALLASSSIAAFAGLDRRSKLLLLLAILYFVFVGFRFHIGVDWNNYIYHYETAARRGLVETLLLPEPGFGMVYLLARELAGGVIFINALSAAVFCLGLFLFVRRCPEPFLALVMASPYLTFVIAMSATRQAMSIGLIFYLFAKWEKLRTWVKVALVVLASLFHFSALLMLAFVAYGSRASFGARVAGVMGTMAIVLAVVSFAPSRADFYAATYVGAGGGAITASGAVAHVLLVSLPAAAYLTLRGAWIARLGRSQLVDSLAVGAVLLLPLIYFSSIGADRMSLYFWPVTLYVVSGGATFLNEGTARYLYRALVIIASFALLIGWMTYANSKYAYVPYKNYWLVPEWASLWRR